jgi:hypothetical protein
MSASSLLYRIYHALPQKNVELKPAAFLGTMRTKLCDQLLDLNETIVYCIMMFLMFTVHYGQDWAGQLTQAKKSSVHSQLRTNKREDYPYSTR